MNTEASEQSGQEDLRMGQVDEAAQAGLENDEDESELDGDEIGEDTIDSTGEHEAHLDEEGEYTEVGSQDNEVEKDV